MKHKVTFLPENVTVEVDPADYPYGNHGEPGSLLDIALEHGVELEHNCGGNCACTTCHVIVRQGEENLSEMEEEEEDKLDQAPGLTPIRGLAANASSGATSRSRYRNSRKSGRNAA